VKVEIGDTWETDKGYEVVVTKSAGRGMWYANFVGKSNQLLLYFESEFIKLISAQGLLPYSRACIPFVDYVPYEYACSHEWVDAGFHFSVWCCRKCNVDKPK
jgi:hypothetical protein